MPNWCYNELHIEGDSDEFKRFMAASTGLPARYALNEWDVASGYQYPTEPRFCFNALVPTPPEVLELGYNGHQYWRAVHRIALLILIWKGIIYMIVNHIDAQFHCEGITYSIAFSLDHQK